MTLNPSCNLEEGRIGFPTIEDAPFDKKGRDFALTELRVAGFPRGSDRVTVQEVEVYVEGSEAHKLAKMGIHIGSVCAGKSETEWINVYTVRAELYEWTFYRAWYYWVAETKNKSYAVPKTFAQKLNEDKNNREEIRVEGFAGGRDVTRQVEFYHIDTPRGLNEFVKLLKKIDELHVAAYDKALPHKDKQRFYDLGYVVRWDIEFEHYGVFRVDGDEAQGRGCETLEDVEAWIAIDQKNRDMK